MKITKYQFRKRFTFAERVAITTASKENAQVQTLMDDLFSSGDVSDWDAVSSGLDLLIYAGILEAGRKAEILAVQNTGHIKYYRILRSSVPDAEAWITANAAGVTEVTPTGEYVDFEAQTAPEPAQEI